jgi:hypothetical protein
MKNLATKGLLLMASVLAQPAWADAKIFYDPCDGCTYPNALDPEIAAEFLPPGIPTAGDPGPALYHGGDGATPAGDIVGAEEAFDVLSMTVSRSGTNLVVSILTRFAEGQLVDDGLGGYVPTTILYGDLMIATTSGWHPGSSGGPGTGTAPYDEDTASNSGTTWNYVVRTDGGDVYENAALELSDTAPNDGVYRQDQYVRYLSGGTSSGSADVLIESVFLPDANDGTTLTSGTRLTYTIPFAVLGGIGLPNADPAEMALRWTMTCANDIVEAALLVPEPTSLSLFLAGLAGWRWMRRSERPAKVAAG